MAIAPETLEKLRGEMEPPTADLSWLDLSLPDTRATPGRRGLTLDDINVAPYGDPLETTSNFGMAPRGVGQRPEAPRKGVAYQEKADVWSKNATLLYEEAVQRQWSSATDIPWEELPPLPDDIEQAMCQYCTFLTEVEFIAGDVPGQWLPKISPEYYESKLFLASQIMDEARHLDVFRKRAFANGGGLRQQTDENGLRALINAKDFTEMSALMHVLAEGFVQSLFRMGEYIGQSEVDQRIFRMCAQDESRHIAFGIMHLKYVLETQPWRREELHSYFDLFEADLARPIEAMDMDPTNEALLILLGDKIDEGIQRSMAVGKRRVNEYMHRLEVAGMPERRERMNPTFQMMLAGGAG
ncbi:MAG: ferritin-like domain-containing protein [Dehalococcoidia bacterium]|nr:ferritin-like domain-containing protein [Dehalococcoidia bacterium]